MRIFGSALGVAIGLALLVVLSSLAAAGSGTASAAPQTMVKGPFYNVTFTETGLPAGTNWSVHVAYVGCGCDGVRKTVTSNTPSITIPVTNGTYNYNILKVPGYFVNVSAHGTFNVSATDIPSVSVVFYPVVPFLAEFTEIGLPNGTLWTVTVTGNGHGQERAIEDQTASSYGTSLNFSLPNGTYHFTVAKVPGSFFVGNSWHGKFVIAGASPPATQVTFTTPPTYALTFTETGLPNGTNWSVRVAGWGGVKISETHSSTTNTVTFSLPNGSYRYVVAEVLGFSVNGSITGHEQITNTSVAVNVSFLQLVEGAFYPVAFEENGLPAGTHWAVTVTATHTFGHSRSTTQSSDGTMIYFLLQNSTYRFQVHAVKEYTISSGGSGTFSVAGSSPGVQVVNFTAIPTYTMTFSESGLPNGTNWSILVRSTNAHSTPWLIHVVQTANTTSITFTTLPNGSYCYKIYPIAGWHLTSGALAGSFNVTGASPPGISVTWAPKG